MEPFYNSLFCFDDTVNNPEERTHHFTLYFYDKDLYKSSKNRVVDKVKGYTSIIIIQLSEEE